MPNEADGSAPPVEKKEGGGEIEPRGLITRLETPRNGSLGGKNAAARGRDDATKRVYEKD